MPLARVRHAFVKARDTAPAFSTAQFFSWSGEANLKNASDGGGRLKVSGPSVFRLWLETGICWSRLDTRTAVGIGRKQVEMDELMASEQAADCPHVRTRNNPTRA